MDQTSFVVLCCVVLRCIVLSCLRYLLDFFHVHFVGSFAVLDKGCELRHHHLVIIIMMIMMMMVMIKDINCFVR